MKKIWQIIKKLSSGKGLATMGVLLVSAITILMFNAYTKDGSNGVKNLTDASIRNGAVAVGNTLTAGDASAEAKADSAKTAAPSGVTQEQLNEAIQGVRNEVAGAITATSAKNDKQVSIPLINIPDPSASRTGDEAFQVAVEVTNQAAAINVGMDALRGSSAFNTIIDPNQQALIAKAFMGGLSSLDDGGETMVAMAGIGRQIRDDTTVVALNANDLATKNAVVTGALTLKQLIDGGRFTKQEAEALARLTFETGELVFLNNAGDDAKKIRSKDLAKLERRIVTAQRAANRLNERFAGAYVRGCNLVIPAKAEKTIDQGDVDIKCD